MSERTVITVGAKAPRYEGEATFADGHAAQIRRATLTVDDQTEEIVIQIWREPDRRWAFDQLRALRDQAGQRGLTLGLADNDPARLMVTDPTGAQLIRKFAPHLGRRIVTVRRRKLALLALAAVASVALMVTVLVPRLADNLAAFIPPEGEAALGDATLEQIRVALDNRGLGIGVRFCEQPDGRAALDVMTARLEGFAALETPLSVSVLDHPMINAFALPGGRVVLFRGLIDAAESSDEVAAVLAHEIGHVAARDPTRIALRSAGSIGVLGLLFGDFAGGALVLFLTERIIQADYTQEAEAAADAYATRLLGDSGIPPFALAEFFERLQERGGEIPAILEHFLAHPAMEDRIAAARNTTFDSATAAPALSAEDWAALQEICSR